MLRLVENPNCCYDLTFRVSDNIPIRVYEIAIGVRLEPVRVIEVDLPADRVHPILRAHSDLSCALLEIGTAPGRNRYDPSSSTGAVERSEERRVGKESSAEVQRS